MTTDSSLSNACKTSIRKRRNHNDQKEYTSFVPQPLPREVPSDTSIEFQACASHSARQENVWHPYLVSTGADYTQHRFPVTPASTTEIRKRPRYHEPSHPIYENPHPQNQLTPSTNKEDWMYTPVSRPCHPSFIKSSIRATTNHVRIQNAPTSLNSSHMIRRSRANEPLPIEALSFASPNEFDLFNGELLSDHSDRDESISPLPCPSFKNH